MAIITKMISDEKANTDERLLQPFVQLQMSGLRLTSKKVRPSHLLGLPKETHQPPLQPKVSKSKSGNLIRIWKIDESQNASNIPWHSGQKMSH